MSEAPVRILVVEDEGIVAMDIRSTLETLGYQVVGCVPSGEEAVAMAESKRPDLVLMDVRLQRRMTGIEAARTIRERFQIPCLFLTAYADRKLLEEAKVLNALGYLLKPFDERELGVAVAMALHRWQVEAGLRQALREARGEAAQAGALPPPLQILTLGRFEVRLEGRSVARAEDLTRALRSLLALLLSSPELRVGQEEVQLALWPESPPDKARSCFDSLLLRLRRTLGERLGPQHPVRDYLCLQRGILCLHNCLVDVVEFSALAKKGAEHLRRLETEAAERAFTAALHLWQGPFLPANGALERVHDVQLELERLFIETSLSYGELLVAGGRGELAVEVLEQGLKTDRTNDALVKALYRCLFDLGQAGKAAEVLRQYETALRQAEFTPREIARIVDGVVSVRR